MSAEYVEFVLEVGAVERLQASAYFATSRGFSAHRIRRSGSVGGVAVLVPGS